jgi:uroporphyrinogen decarboxylase
MIDPDAGQPRAPFLRACLSLPVDRTPVWFMRQAGRYMPEYRAIRKKHSLLDICRNPELAVEVTLQPVEALAVDAAILFADILLPLIPMGAELRFVESRGPVIDNPVRTASDVDRLKPVDVEDALGYVLRAVRMLSSELPAEVPLIGFAGAPFTVGCYLIEGGGSRNYERAKALMYGDPETWHGLMERLSDLLARYLLAQIEAGAQAVQLFDSWVGALSPDDYRDYVQPHSASLLQRVAASGVPIIHFGTGTASLLPQMREAGGSVLGVDWRIPLDLAWERIGTDRAIQGNLDPTALFAPTEILERLVLRVLRQAGGRPGHIFNLGHGILPTTPVENVKAVVELVHELSEVGEEKVIT